MFDSFDKAKAPIFKAGLLGLFMGALVLGATFGIPSALSESSEARQYSLLAAMGGAVLGSIAGAVVGIIVGAIAFARQKNS